MSYYTRILATADWHIGRYNGPTANGENLRYLDICRSLDGLVEGAKEDKPDCIIVSGDIFNQARTWSVQGLQEVETAVSYIRKLAAIAPTVVLRGTPNHDGAQHYEMLKSALEYDKGVQVVTEPTVVKVGLKYDGGTINVACLPGFDRGYFRAKNAGLDKEEENAVFGKLIAEMILGLKAQCTARYAQILATHYTVEGANTESGQTAFFAKFEPCIDTATLAMILPPTVGTHVTQTRVTQQLPLHSTVAA